MNAHNPNQIDNRISMVKRLVFGLECLTGAKSDWCLKQLLPTTVAMICILFAQLPQKLLFLRT